MLNAVGKNVKELHISQPFQLPHHIHWEMSGSTCLNLNLNLNGYNVGSCWIYHTRVEARPELASSAQGWSALESLQPRPCSCWGWYIASIMHSSQVEWWTDPKVLMMWPDRTSLHSPAIHLVKMRAMASMQDNVGAINYHTIYRHVKGEETSNLATYYWLREQCKFFENCAKT